MNKLKKKRLITLRAILIAVSLSFLLSLTKLAMAAPWISPKRIDEYLTGKGSPLAGYGDVFVRKGREYNIDPRLLVAIAGAESTFGKRICADFNAWNWFYKDRNDCPKNPFDSWEDGIGKVTKGLRDLYLDKGLTTIPSIGDIYCGKEKGCEHWVPNVELFYEDELGGDPNDLTFQEGLDLIFAIDTTYSMRDDIDQVKIYSTDIVKALDSSGFDYRIAVVDYRDFPVWPYGKPSVDYPYKADSPFTSDKNAIISAILGLTLGSGMDWPESVYSALIRSINTEDLGEWRNGVLKILILMGDAWPHDPEPFTGYTLSSVVAAAQAVDPASIYAIAIGTNSTTYSYFSTLAEETGGEIFNAPQAKHVVEAILSAIETVQQSPIAEAGGPYTGFAGSSITFDASGSHDPNGRIVSYNWDWENDGVYDDTTGSPLITHAWDKQFSGTVRLKVIDNDGLSGVDIAAVEIIGNQPPVADAGPDQVIPAGEECLAMVTLDATSSSDPDGDPLTYTWSGPFGTITGSTPTVTLGLGSHTITLTVDDGRGGIASDAVLVTVEDQTPPTILLSDPVCENVGQGKGKMANKLTVSATDNCSEVIDLTIDEIDIYNNGGNLVKGEGVYEISGFDIFVYPNAEGWSIKVTATAVDESGNTTTQILNKSLIKCKK